MTGRRTQPDRMALAAVVFLVLGLGAWAVYRYLAPSEQHSYSPGATPPAYVQLTEGTNYSLGVRGGAEELQKTIPLTTLQCSYAVPGGSARSLPITPEQSQTKATNRVATFTAPVSGRTHVECAGVPAVFVDDADGAGDASGWFLVLASLALAIGLPLALSMARRATGHTTEDTAGHTAAQPTR